jgi:hypothetical protein
LPDLALTAQIGPLIRRRQEKVLPDEGQGEGGRREGLEEVVPAVAADHTAAGPSLVRYLAGSARPELPNIAIRGVTISAAL